jgi:hypothetical protein
MYRQAINGTGLDVAVIVVASLVAMSIVGALLVVVS